MAGTCAGEGPIALESTEGLAGSGADLSDDARAILESMGDAFYALDGAWRITYANKRALDFWQTSLEAVYGRVLWDCFPALHGTRNAEVIRRAQAELPAAAVQRFVAAVLDARRVGRRGRLG
ncbi:MAG: PAS domain-containing protein, partial [Rhodospirillales bacterium]|nr:PAS domain-containing protein [Rhodospirillales bacterium]